MSDSAPENLTLELYRAVPMLPKYCGRPALPATGGRESNIGVLSPARSFAVLTRPNDGGCMAAHLSQSLDLAQRRTAKGISLWAIESSTRIAVHFLEVIEAEDFRELPGGVYTTSYLRQYARASGLDEAALLRRYYAKIAPAPAAERSFGPDQVHAMAARVPHTARASSLDRRPRKPERRLISHSAG
jgi:hypothetical protein